MLRGSAKRGANIHEVCHLFAVHVDSLELGVNPTSLESHLEFYWAEFCTESLVRNDVLPTVIQKSLLSLCEGETHWISSFES
jgi:8-oxo-dGTP diphosphatase